LILDKTLVVKTHKDHNGKYGRLLVDVFIGDKSLADILIDLKYATCLAAYISLEYSLEAVANDVHCSRYVSVGSP
jgi:endonuclease YncB( thermonuclease family)